ncbi:MAG: U32 family peptidase, partial [Prolixibacteraceae bacterium]|nr:U32 family peptidase [Prolixibacteraceae bacterium]
VKVYVTLNTVVRNDELSKLLETLHVLSQIHPDAIIVQDWGVVYLVKKYFPKLTLHASTQMAIHNADGVKHAASRGITRVVLARELTCTELSNIAHQSKIELELFIHGALCYSFSGMCLFSSFLGGSSANRGQCTQPCRRNYAQHESESYFFSLKDNQLIDHLPFLQSLKIHSLKVEGRLKSADYVLTVARAYRKALDQPHLQEEAQAELARDLGREKTDYFYGKQVNAAITQSANTGLYLGTVLRVQEGMVVFQSNEKLLNDSRLRIRKPGTDEQLMVAVNRFSFQETEVHFTSDEKGIAPGDEVYLAAEPAQLPAKIKTEGIKINVRLNEAKAKIMLNSLRFKQETQQAKTEVFLRFDHPDWFGLIGERDFHELIFQLNKKNIELISKQFDTLKKFPLAFELPRFIPEADLDFYRKELAELVTKGFRRFYLSHLSQQLLLPRGCSISVNENVYLFNDAAIRQVLSEGIEQFIYPCENDVMNLSRGSNRQGIVPLYFTPYLFYSRMPITANKEDAFTDKNGEQFRKLVRDGITIIVPAQPVALTQFKSKLDRYGFYRYLIDLCTLEPEAGLPGKLKKKVLNSEKVAHSSLFNFKRELK